jgi:disulfide bond formation protein DsbB
VSQLCAVGVALTAEFTAVGDLFELVIGTVRWPIVIIIGIVSAIYTAYGGLYVSIVTDQVPQNTNPQVATPLPCCSPAISAGVGSLVLTFWGPALNRYRRGVLSASS